MSPSALLDVQGIRAGYGRMEVVHDVRWTMSPGEVVAMVGRNGAGKTTTLRALAGLRDELFGGRVFFDAVDITRFTPARVVAMGMVLVPEGRRLFRAMTVEENLRLGAYSRRREPLSQIDETLGQVFTLFPVLERYRHRPCGNLSGGEQQMAAIGRAMMAKPRLFLLDEPTSGLAPAICDHLYEAITSLAGAGAGVLVVEQSVERALAGAARVLVMDRGQLVSDTASSDLSAADLARSIVGVEA